jgi:hypothetical protein
MDFGKAEVVQQPGTVLQRAEEGDVYVAVRTQVVVNKDIEDNFAEVYCEQSLPFFSQQSIIVITAEQEGSPYNGLQTPQVPVYTKATGNSPGIICKETATPKVTVVPWTPFQPSKDININTKVFYSGENKIDLASSASTAAGILTLFTSGGNPIVGGLTKAATDKSISDAQTALNKASKTEIEKIPKIKITPEHIKQGKTKWLSPIKEVQATKPFQSFKTVLTRAVKDNTKKDVILNIIVEVETLRSVFFDERKNDGLPEVYQKEDIDNYVLNYNGTGSPGNASIIQRFADRAPSVLQAFAKAQTKDALNAPDVCPTIVQTILSLGLNRVDEAIVAHALYTRARPGLPVFQTDRHFLQSYCFPTSPPQAPRKVRIGDLMPLIFYLESYAKATEPQRHEIDDKQVIKPWVEAMDEQMTTFQYALPSSELPSARAFNSLNNSGLLADNVTFSSDAHDLDQMQAQLLTRADAILQLAKLETAVVGCHIPPLNATPGTREGAIAYFPKAPRFTEPSLIVLSLDNAGKISEISFRRTYPGDRNGYHQMLSTYTAAPTSGCAKIQLWRTKGRENPGVQPSS